MLDIILNSLLLLLRSLLNLILVLLLLSSHQRLFFILLCQFSLFISLLSSKLCSCQTSSSFLLVVRVLLHLIIFTNAICHLQRLFSVLNLPSEFAIVDDQLVDYHFSFGESVAATAATAFTTFVTTSFISSSVCSVAVFLNFSSYCSCYSKASWLFGVCSR